MLAKIHNLSTGESYTVSDVSQCKDSVDAEGYTLARYEYTTIVVGKTVVEPLSITGETIL